MKAPCIGCEVAEATVVALCAACDHLVCNVFKLAEKQLLAPLPSHAASSASKGDVNQMLAEEVDVAALYWTSDWSKEKHKIVPSLPSSPGEIYMAAVATAVSDDEEKQQSIHLSSLTASSSVYKEAEAATAPMVPLASLTSSPCNIYKDGSDVDDLHGTCVWAAQFKFTSFAVVDTQATTPPRRKGDSDKYDKMRKKFYYITDDIMVLTAGIIPFSEICIGRLRDLKDKFELRCSPTDQNIKERTGNRKKLLDLKKLVALFLNGSHLKTFMHNVKARKGRYLAKGEEDDITSLILISRSEEREESVCKINLIIENQTISVYWGWAMGAGSGFSTAEKTLADLTQSSDETQIIELVKRGFRNASQKDKGTGGSVLILKGSKDVAWDIVEACDI